MQLMQNKVLFLNNRYSFFTRDAHKIIQKLVCYYCNIKYHFTYFRVRSKNQNEKLKKKTKKKKNELQKLKILMINKKKEYYIGYPGTQRTNHFKNQRMV